MEEQLKTAIVEALDAKLGYYRQSDGTFEYEIFADYRDEMENKTATEILRSDEPMDAFWEQMDDWYSDYELELRTELEDELQGELIDQGWDEDTLEPLHDMLLELVYYRLPDEHFLKQIFPVNIMLDTGDGNYDYTLNSVYPCWYGSYHSRIDDKASIVWLARTQGYSRGKLQKALKLGDMSKPNGFLESMRVELANLASAMSTVTFLVELTLEELIELNRLIRLQDRLR